jgi:hypothetical protein
MEEHLHLRVGYLVRRDGKNVRTVFNEEANLYFDHDGRVIGVGDKRARSTFMPPKFTVDPFYIKLTVPTTPPSPHPEK